MKVVQINATCGVGSTGKICVGISQMMTEKNMENYILYSSRTNGYPLGIRCSNSKYIKIQAIKSRILGNYGFNSNTATNKIVRSLEKIKPDVVHLHNIHGHDCNLETLFKYFKKQKIKLVWTFHDCWAFTAYCPHFVMAGCDKWKEKCCNCVQKRSFSWLFDRSSYLYEKKKTLFSGVDLTVVTPSVWLADLVKQSFLSEFPVKVIGNGIDLNVFRPTHGDFRKKYKIAEDEKIVLGASFGWGRSKGLDVFIELAGRLPKDYRIVLVGTDTQLDKKLPCNVISINRTHDQKELAEIYTASDVFVNPTREDSYPTVNMESIACGTPVITFRTGGSPEMLDENCGAVVECNNVDALEKEIIRICTEKPYSKEECIKSAKRFDKNERFREYARLYEDFDFV